MKNKLWVSLLLLVCLILSSASACSVIGSNGCPNGSAPVMVAGNRVCQVTGTADPTPMAGFQILGEELKK